MVTGLRLFGYYADAEYAAVSNDRSFVSGVAFIFRDAAISHGNV